MSITIRVNGNDYTNFISASCEIQLDALCNSFEIEVATTNDAPLPFVGGEECEIYVNGVKKVTGKIENSDGSYSSSSHQISFSGRDKTSDLLDSKIGALSDIKAPVTLKAICEKVISHIGSDIIVVENTPTITFNRAEDLMAPEPGQGCYEFLEALANKRQVLLSSNEDGNLVLTQSDPVNSGGRLQNILNDNKNNILSASWNYDNTQRFNVYQALSQLNPTALNFGGETDLDSVVDQGSRITDNEVKKGRQYVFKPDKSSSSAENKTRAEWELNMRKARSRVYSTVVTGHTIATDEVEIWETNTLVEIIDVFAGINGVMLINKINFSTDLEEGNESELHFVPANSYTTEISEPISNTNKIGQGFTTF
jgi:prophage tail gpP-like protein